jgi:hypothetical protein
MRSYIENGGENVIENVIRNVVENVIENALKTVALLTSLKPVQFLLKLRHLENLYCSTLPKYYYSQIKMMH